jgi:saccharopine dehydrogenase (NAD+, L-lysine-forming)
MRILVVGAGAVGSVLAKILAKERGVSVSCAANDLPAARRFLGADGKRVGLVRTDASDAAAVARAAKGSDLVVNASLPKFNLKLLRAALVARANYLDLDSLLKDWRHAEQLTYDKLFAKAGLTGLINAGVSPGLTNLLAAEAAERFATLDTLRFRILEEQDAERFIPSWSANVLKDELESWPLVFRRGKFAHVRPLKASETFRFPAPFGKRRVVSVYGDEIATVPLFLPVKNADYMTRGSSSRSRRPAAASAARADSPGTPSSPTSAASCAGTRARRTSAIRPRCARPRSRSPSPK